MTLHTSAASTVQAEQVLARQLSTGQQVMMAIGGAIGTGLFLGSGLVVQIAGPAVILSYIIAAAIALLLGAALTEMCVVHPTAGSFGVYASTYLSPFAGYVSRVSYTLAQIIATGGHMVAVSIYMQYWFPDMPGAVWVIFFSAVLLYVNARSVGTLGTIEYWVAAIKVIAIVLFVLLGLSLILGSMDEARPLFTNYTAYGGFLPTGLTGVWMGVCFALYSFIGVEIVAVTSGEAVNPARTIPRAMRRMVFGLTAIYVVTVAVLVGIMPWNQVGVQESPFVSVLGRTGIPGAASFMNFVVLSAALSSANANLYTIIRMLFSLARGGLAPSALGQVTSSGVPMNALLVSSLSLAAAILVRALWPDSAYVWFLGVALFGGLVVWLIIFLTHLAFRRRWEAREAGSLPVRLPFARTRSMLGATLIAAAIVTTWWAPGLRITLLSAGPWLLVLAVGYLITRRSQGPIADL